MSKNELATKEAGKALAEALAANSVLKELDVSSKCIRMLRLDVQVLAPGLTCYGAGTVEVNGSYQKILKIP